MRKQFVQCDSRRDAYKECPWASKVTKVKDGFVCFESVNDYKLFKTQR